MEQPSNGGGEDGGAKTKEVAEELERKSSGQETDPSPNPDPKSTGVNREQTNEKQNSENNSSSSNRIVLNENININSNNNDSNESDESASPLNSKSKKSVRWSEELVSESPEPRSRTVSFSENFGSNPYVAHSPAPSDNSSSVNIKNTMESVKDVLGRWGRNVKEATKKAEDLAGNTWQHLKTGPSLADAALGRIAQGTKVLAEGGYEKIFRQTFETVPEEQLQNSFACYLSTSAGPVMGILYVSTAKLAFCSDNPLSYKSDDKTEWSYYKVDVCISHALLLYGCTFSRYPVFSRWIFEVVIPLHQLKAVNPSSSRNNPSEKYIQVISVDNHEFWFMGFLNYDGAVKCLQGVLQAQHLQSV